MTIPEPGLGYLRTPEDDECKCPCPRCGSEVDIRELNFYETASGKMCKECYEATCPECDHKSQLIHDGLMKGMAKCVNTDCQGLFLWNEKRERWDFVGSSLDDVEVITVMEAA